MLILDRNLEDIQNVKLLKSSMVCLLPIQSSVYKVLNFFRLTISFDCHVVNPFVCRITQCILPLGELEVECFLIPLVFWNIFSASTIHSLVVKFASLQRTPYPHTERLRLVVEA